MVSEILFQSDCRHLGSGHDWLMMENHTVVARPKRLVWQEFSWMEKILHVLGFGRANLDRVEGVLYEQVKEACEENRRFIQEIKGDLPQTCTQLGMLINRVQAQMGRMQHLCNSIDRLDNQMRACRDKRAFFKGLLALLLEVFRGKAPRLGGKQFGVYDELDKLSRLHRKLYQQIVETASALTQGQGGPLPATLQPDPYLERQPFGEEGVVEQAL